ncbi:hypothetical protein FRACYDRAFT_253243 [Fragilariopsis cylindrus CCMP1102]|uniref:Cytidyltransferase-like domain-containing protein n=1 Tax=Fragilariopsis cylindrus CCMP1102 TaxID=635003 RepID=A0A1E7ELK0_9STRA|nr:hypothetical protein FRACYDRAFT_253243 [Fragilariopsis cylindrus CCMP1102]|eukprot:OEU06788.1 hypothetical protein FRACYDRAFT_253243 [Fragilariopsis cylindrus CCMP1102]
MTFFTNARRTREWKLLLSFVLFIVLSMVVLTVNSFTATTTTTTISSLSTFRTTSFSRIRRQHTSFSTTTGNYKSSLTCCKAHKESNNNQKRFKHTIAILNMPYTSTDKIANEAILNQAIQHTSKLSVVLRCQNDDKPSPSLARLRRYVGEVYSTLWDAVSLSDNNDDDIDLDCDFCDVVVYPQNLPNAAPESWINDVAPDLDSICSHDSICGWVSGSAMGRGKQFQFSEGTGGLDAHVAAINANRENSNLSPVVAVHVEPWPKGASSKWQSNNNVAFLDDDSTDDEDEENEDENDRNMNTNNIGGKSSNNDDDDDDEGDIYGSIIGGARIPTKSLFEKVAVAGTFDGMHYGHRKLLTLAVSSVSPRSVDEMLGNKSFSEDIPNLQERMGIVRDFVYRLAPGMKNRVRFIPLADEYGPPGTLDEGPNFDALVLSHETLDNGHKLNEHRKETLGLKPLTLLCTRRTEPHGMSSTSLRRRRRERQKRREQKQQEQEAKSSI